MSFKSSLKMVFCFSGLKISVANAADYLVKIEGGNRLKGSLGVLYDKFFVIKNQR